MTISTRFLFLILAFMVIAIISGITQANAAEKDIGAELIAKTIKSAANLDSELNVEIIKGRATIDEAKEAKMEVTKLEFDNNTGMFSAYVSANNALPFEVAGRYYEIIRVPVLSRKFVKNEVIERADIQYIEVESTKLKNGYILNEEQIIGKSPARTIQKARPVIESQLTTPKAIERSKQVTMIYKNDALSIRATGIALQDGAVGDTIKFKNADSGRIVHAKVINGMTAEIKSANSELASN